MIPRQIHHDENWYLFKINLQLSWDANRQDVHTTDNQTTHSIVSSVMISMVRSWGQAVLIGGWKIEPHYWSTPFTKICFQTVLHLKQKRMEYSPWIPRSLRSEANLNTKLEISWLLTYWQHTWSDEIVLSWEDKRLAHHVLHRTIDFLFPNTTTTYSFMFRTSFWIVLQYRVYRKSKKAANVSCSWDLMEQ